MMTPTSAALAEGRRPLKGLTSLVYEHPDDRAFLAAFKAIPGAGRVVGWCVDHYARKQHLQMLGNGMQVTPRSLPSLHRIYRRAAACLDLLAPPPLYTVTGPPNAYTTGADRAMVVVTSMAVDLLSDDELLFVLGHELGHYQAGHVVYHSLGQMLRYGAQELSGLSAGLAGSIADATLGPTLYAWMRRSEFTADRAGLLACQDERAARRAMTKLAGVPSRLVDEMSADALLEQAEAYADEGEGNLLYRLLELHDTLAMTHQYWVLRAVELQQWVEDGFYEDVVSGTPADFGRMAALATEDPAVQALASSVTRVTAPWAADRFGMTPLEAGRIVRRMVYAGDRPDGTPLEGLRRLELHVAKNGPADFTASVEAIFLERGRARGATIPVPFEGSWEQQPATLREEFIRTGADRLTRLLYSSGAE